MNAVSFTARSGGVTGHLGPNGSGKSTTMKMITGLIEPSEGEIRFGGVYAQYFAQTNLDRIAGVVLVDATHEDLFERLPTYVRLFDWTLLLERQLRIAGVSRLLPQSSDPTIRVFRNSNKQLQAVTKEETEDHLGALRELDVSLGNRPLIVLTSEHTQATDFLRPLHADFLDRSERSRQVIVAGSRHNIQTDDPAAVSNLIREVVAEVR